MAEQRRLFAWNEMNVRELDTLLKSFKQAEHPDPGAYTQLLLELRRWTG